MQVNLKPIKEQIDTTLSIELITEALSDIATSKLKSTRGSIEHTVSYFHQISDLYKVVKSVAVRSKTIKHLPKRKNNGKTVCVLLTSNSRLYGSLDTELTKFYFDQTIKLNCDRMVIGHFGAEILRSLSYRKPYEAIIFKKDAPEISELSPIALKLFNYARILVFYSKFKTLLNQEPFISDISTSYLEETDPKTPYHYITEPEIDKILAFFDAQISFLMFQSIFLEVDLSRLAYQMISMNQAQENAKKILKGQKKELLKFRKALINEQILENFSSMIGRNE